MADMTDFAKNLLARALCARVPALPTAVWAALGTGGSDATGLTGEPAGNGYARQRVTFTGTGPQRNVSAFSFTFTGAAGTLSHLGLFDAATGGNALTWGTLSSPVAVPGPGTVTVAADALTVTPE
jgi:hypothetical protein